MGNLGIFGRSVAEEYPKDQAMEQEDGEGVLDLGGAGGVADGCRRAAAAAFSGRHGR